MPAYLGIGDVCLLALSVSCVRIIGFGVLYWCAPPAGGIAARDGGGFIPDELPHIGKFMRDGLDKGGSRRKGPGGGAVLSGPLVLGGVIS